MFFVMINCRDGHGLCQLTSCDQRIKESSVLPTAHKIENNNFIQFFKYSFICLLKHSLWIHVRTESLTLVRLRCDGGTFQAHVFLTKSDEIWIIIIKCSDSLGWHSKGFRVEYFVLLHMKNRFVIVYIFSFLHIYDGDISPSIHLLFILVRKMI